MKTTLFSRLTFISLLQCQINNPPSCALHNGVAFIFPNQNARFLLASSLKDYHDIMNVVVLYNVWGTSTNKALFEMPWLTCSASCLFCFDFCCRWGVVVHAWLLFCYTNFIVVLIRSQLLNCSVVLHPNYNFARQPFPMLFIFGNNCNF